MKRPCPGPARAGSIVELVLLLTILAGACHVVWHLMTYGYLRQPFIWDPTDTFMDWYNPAYWAHREGIYNVWRAVYPPLSFAVLKLFSIESCYVSTSFAGRDCDWVGKIAILGSYALATVVSFQSIRRCQPRSTTWLRTLALAFGLPGLFLLERGNLLILCYIALIYAFCSVDQSGWKRIFGAGIMINFKPYLLVPMAAWAIRREWRMLELAGFATVAIYLVSWAFVGGGSPFEIIDNTANWVTVTGTDVVGEVFYTTSFHSLFGVIERGFPVSNYVPSAQYELFRYWVFTAMLTAQATGVVALAAAWLQPQAASQSRLALLLMLLSLTYRSPGGYSELLVVFFVFLEPWKRPGPILAIVTAYVISIPYDWIVSYLPNVNTVSWITGQSVTGRFGIGVGQLLRPMGLLLILFMLAFDTIAEVARAHRHSRPMIGFSPARVAG